MARAKASFSELVREAAKAPQRVDSRGRAVAVVLGADEYERLTKRAESTSDRARVREFLRLSAELREHGGGEIAVAAREARPSPFGDRAARTRRKRA
jgi:prevent-host-death family protein